MSSKITSLKDPLTEITEEFLSNPYPMLAKLRTEAPVFWSDTGQYWMITRYAEAKEVLSDLAHSNDAQRWEKAGSAVQMFPELTEVTKSHKHWVLNMDPPGHTRLKSLLSKAFAPSIVGQMRKHIQDIAHELIDMVEDKNEMDAIADFAFPLPITVIAGVLGVPAADCEKFKIWSHSIVIATSPQGVPEPGMDIEMLRGGIRSFHDLLDYLRPLVEQRRKYPKNDLISILAQAEEEGSSLSQEELLANVLLFLVAGHETTTNLIGNGIYNLIKHPDQLEHLKQKPELIESAVNEILRFESSVQLVRRFAGKTIELDGQTVKEGDMIIVMLGAANRDPAEFENPDKFDITRSGKKHLSFGHGIHRCLGVPLAELEGQIALSTVFRRLPNLRLKTNNLKWRLPFALRGVTTLPLSFQ